MTERIDVAGLGFVVLDRVYRHGRLVLEDLGGTCGNVTSALAALGHRVAPVATLGDDEVGRLLTSRFREAGCVVDYVFARTGVRSPVVAQTFDDVTGDHAFTFTCPETGERYPRAVPVDAAGLEEAGRAFRECRVLFADRVSATVLRAMRTTREAGGHVFFEPDPKTVKRKEDFEAAMALATIAKFSDEGLPDMEGYLGAAGCVPIVTRGAAGSRVVDGRRDSPDAGVVASSPAVPADPFVDACGAGDMTSVGVVDAVLRMPVGEGLGPLATFVRGVAAGQRLASVNCSYVGARGALRRLGATGVRAVLDARE